VLRRLLRARFSAFVLAAEAENRDPAGRRQAVAGVAAVCRQLGVRPKVHRIGRVRARVIGVGDGASPGVHVPNLVGHAGCASRLAEAPGELALAVRTPGPLVEDDGSDPARRRDDRELGHNGRQQSKVEFGEYPENIGDAVAASLQLAAQAAGTGETVEVFRLLSAAEIDKSLRNAGLYVPPKA